MIDGSHVFMSANKPQKMARGAMSFWAVSEDYIDQMIHVRDTVEM